MVSLPNRPRRTVRETSLASLHSKRSIPAVGFGNSRLLISAVDSSCSSFREPGSRAKTCHPQFFSMSA